MGENSNFDLTGEEGVIKDKRKKKENGVEASETDQQPRKTAAYS